MSVKATVDAEIGLQFFGKMTASITHEIKNVLAIINENAGLLEDLALMAGRGAAIDPQRLTNMSQAVMKQVNRADAIVKNMNRLAHSVDEPEKTIDLDDILELLVALSNRFAAMHGVVLQLKLAEGPVKLRTFPFLLLNLLWICMHYSMNAAGEDKRVELTTRKTADGIEVFFKGLGGLAGAALKPFQTEPEKDLCKLLGAELEIRGGSQAMIVRFAEKNNHQRR